ncbi:glycosyltransferase family 4 protein [Croceibacter atlanticus]|uniref:glycosyltransferase family 4 protein n=1 Tax=Croceibacter atlanticus TaxID=313588 RepID=UPI0030F9929D
MIKPKIVRITTVVFSLEKLLENQLQFMKSYYKVIAVSSNKIKLDQFGKVQNIQTFNLDLTRKITPLRDFISLFKLIFFLLKEKPLILHSHTPKAGIVGMLAAYVTRVPYRLHTVAGLPLIESTGIKRSVLILVEKLTYACATKVYPNSKGLEDFILKENFTKSSKLKIIGNGSSNGIDTTYFDPDLYIETFKNDLKLKLGIPESDKVFIFVGRLVSDKGINELVTAFNKLQQNHQNIKLLLVGPLESDLDPLHKQTLNTIKCNQHIISLGFQKDVRPYLAISDMLTFPSYREGFPNVVLQAGAMGLPCIVSNINGCNEIIIDNINGIIVPKKNTDALADAMCVLIKNPILFNKLRVNARKLIQEKYERKVFWKALLKEYKSLE